MTQNDSKKAQNPAIFILCKNEDIELLNIYLNMALFDKTLLEPLLLPHNSFNIIAEHIKKQV